MLAYTFELGRCYEDTIRQRQLRALAQIDAELCERVALGLGLEIPGSEGSSADSPPEGACSSAAPSPALSQVGGEWPVDGRVVGIVVDPTASLAGLTDVRRALLDDKIVPVVIAPSGGTLPDGTEIQRTFLTVRSIELDALLLAASPAPAPDAVPHAGTKATDEGAARGVDPSVKLLVDECFRQAKVIGGWGEGVHALDALLGSQPGVVTGDGAAEVVDEIRRILRSHRVWDRFPAQAPPWQALMSCRPAPPRGGL